MSWNPFTKVAPQEYEMITYNNGFTNITSKKTALADVTDKLKKVNGRIKVLKQELKQSQEKVDKIEPSGIKRLMEMIKKTPTFSESEKETNQNNLIDLKKQVFAKNIEIEKYLELKKEIASLQKQLKKTQNLEDITGLYSQVVNKAKESNPLSLQVLVKQATEDVHAMKHEAEAALKVLNSSDLQQSDAAFQKLIENIHVPVDDIFFVGAAKKNLSKIQKRLSTRLKDARENYEKEMSRATSVSDFKKLADRYNRLIANTKKAQDDGTKLVDAIDKTTKAWEAQKADILGNSMLGSQAAKNKLIALFTKRASLMKSEVNINLESHIFLLNEFNVNIKKLNIEKFGRKNAAKWLEFETKFPQEIATLSQKLKLDKQMQTDMGGRWEDKNALINTEKIIDMMKNAKVILDKETNQLDFSWDTYFSKYSKVYEGIKVINNNNKDFAQWKEDMNAMGFH